MVFRSLCRLARSLSFKPTIRYSKPLPARFTNFNSIRYFTTQQNTIEALQYQVQKAEKEHGENSIKLIVPYNQLGIALRDKGELPKAAIYLEKSLRIAEKELGGDYQELSIGFSSLGHIFKEIGNMKAAILYYEKALNIEKAKFGETSKEVALTLNNIANLYKYDGNLEKAQEYLKLALPYMQQQVDGNDQDVAIYFLNYGYVTSLKSKVAESIDCYQISKKIYERITGPNSADVADVETHIAYVHWNAGQFEDAKRHLQNAINIRETLRLLDTTLIELYKKLGFLYKDMKNIKDSTEAFERGATIVKGSRGENSSTLAYYYNDIGNNFRLLGDRRFCKPFFNKSLEILQKIPQENTKEISLCYENLSAFAYTNKEFDSAIEYGHKSLEIKRNAKASKQEMAYSYAGLGSIYHSKGDLKEAEFYLMQAKFIAEESKSPDQSILDSIYTTLGLLYRDQEKYPESIESHEKTIELKVKSLGDLHPAIANTYAHIGISYEKWNKIPEAIEAFKKAIEMNEKTLGREHASTSTYIDLLGDVYRKSGQVEDALRAHNAALEIRKGSGGEKDFMVGLSYNNLAFDYRALKDWDKAIEFHEKASQIYLQVYGNQHPYYGGGYILLGEVYEMKGDTESAVENFTKGKQFFINLYGENNELVRKIQKKIEDIKR